VVELAIVKCSKDGRFVLTSPAGGNKWWELADTKRDFAVVCVAADTRNAQQIAETAFDLIVEPSNRS
jgi:hypothetical protein